MSTSAERMRALRERRAAALQPDGDAGPRDPATLLEPVVEANIAVLDLTDRDAAAAELARRYARVIDQARDPVWATRWFGPLLQQALKDLGATPSSRPAARKPADARPNKVAQLRAAHAAAKKRAS